MELLAHADLVLVASGFSLVWLLARGGQTGAGIIFIVAKMVDK